MFRPPTNHRRSAVATILAMHEGPPLARIAALIGDPTRAQMLAALMGGQALTASELADTAGVTKPTASAHLSLIHI